MSGWIEVDGYKEIPKGIWLVKTESKARNYQVAYISDNFSVIGHHFAFDVKGVIAYKELDLE